MVTTDGPCYGGTLQDLANVRRALTDPKTGERTGPPIIAKDLYIHPIQVAQAAALGADGVLLMACLVSHPPTNTRLTLHDPTHATHTPDLDDPTHAKHTTDLERPYTRQPHDSFRAMHTATCPHLSNAPFPPRLWCVWQLGGSMVELLDACTMLGLECVVEVHTVAELEKALELGATNILATNWDRIENELYADQARALRHMIPDLIVSIAAGTFNMTKIRSMYVSDMSIHTPNDVEPIVRQRGVGPIARQKGENVWMSRRGKESIAPPVR